MAKQRKRTMTVTTLFLVCLLLLSARILAEDLIIDGTEYVIDTDTSFAGNIVVRNGGRLSIIDATLTLQLEFDEQYYIDVSGNSRLTVHNGVITSTGGQYWIEFSEDGGRSPEFSVTGDGSLVTNHSGIRPYDETTVNASAGEIEEIQAQDRVTIVLGATAGYLVLFFNSCEVSINNLHTGLNLTNTISIPDGWTVQMSGTEIYGYQLDLQNNAEVTLNGGDGIVLSMHTPGNLGSQWNIVEGLTSSVPANGSCSNLGSSFSFTSTQISMFNLYAHGNDKVLLRNMQVNEANSVEYSEISIGQEGYPTRVNCNLAQAYDYSHFIMDKATIDSTENQPSAACSYHDAIADEGYAVMEFISMNLQELYITALEHGTINLFDCQYDPSKIEIIGPDAHINFIDGTPTPRPTAPPQSTGAFLKLNATVFRPDDPFDLDVSVVNAGAADLQVNLYIALDPGIGQFWFWPGWKHYPPEIDSSPMDLPATSEQMLDILYFTWPDTGGSQASGLIFWAALIDTSQALVGEISHVEFGFSD